MRFRNDATLMGRFELTGPIWALLLSQTHRVRRRDGTHVPSTGTVNWKQEFIALAKPLKSKRVGLLLLSDSKRPLDAASLQHVLTVRSHSCSSPPFTRSLPVACTVPTCLSTFLSAPAPCLPSSTVCPPVSTVFQLQMTDHGSHLFDPARPHLWPDPR